jgi:NIMA (never in mitosis gene a)-related kinase 2
MILFEQLRKYLNEALIWKLFTQMLYGLAECHCGPSAELSSSTAPKRQTILHRDLKPENIFLDAGMNVKVGDFGLSKIDTSAELKPFWLRQRANSEKEEFVGTPYYMAPEILAGAPHSVKSDIWSLGCILYEMCSLRYSSFFTVSILSILDHLLKLNCLKSFLKKLI